MDFAQEFKELQREIRELKTATPGSGGGQTPNDGILTLQQNGTTIQTFSANQSSNATADFNIHGGIMTADNLSPTDDTVAGWATALGGKDGVYCTFYSQTGRFDNQPSRYGFLITTLKRYDSSTYEIYQSWQMSGTYFGEFHRSGFSSAWYGSWARFRQSATMTPNDIAPSSDTPAGWASLFGNQPGYYLTAYSGTKKFTNQPQNWGQLETIIFKQTAISTNYEIYQRWHSQANGHCYYRAANSSGWYGSSSESGAFREMFDNMSSNQWHTFALDVATNDRYSYQIPGHTITIGVSSQGGIEVAGISTSIKRIRMTVSFNLTGAMSKNVGITNLKTNTPFYNRWSGYRNNSITNWSQYSETPTTNYANFFGSGSFTYESGFYEMVLLRRGTTNDWSLSGSLQFIGNLTAIEFMCVCTAKDAVTAPMLYMRGTSAANFSAFNGTVEIFA